MSDEAPQHSSIDVAVKLQLLATRLLRFARLAGQRSGIGSAQYSAMAALYVQAPLALTELARIERVAHPTMSRIVAALVKSGLVARRPDPADRRSQLLDLTDEGRTTYETIVAGRVAMLHAVVDRLRPETVQEVLAAVTTIADQLDQSIAPD